MCCWLLIVGRWSEESQRPLQWFCLGLRLILCLHTSMYTTKPRDPLWGIVCMCFMQWIPVCLDKRCCHVIGRVLLHGAFGNCCHVFGHVTVNVLGALVYLCCNEFLCVFGNSCCRVVGHVKVQRKSGHVATIQLQVSFITQRQDLRACRNLVWQRVHLCVGHVMSKIVSVWVWSNHVWHFHVTALSCVLSCGSSLSTSNGWVHVLGHVSEFTCTWNDFLLQWHNYCCKRWYSCQKHWRATSQPTEVTNLGFQYACRQRQVGGRGRGLGERQDLQRGTHQWTWEVLDQAQERPGGKGGFRRFRERRVARHDGRVWVRRSDTLKLWYGKQGFMIWSLILGSVRTSSENNRTWTWMRGSRSETHKVGVMFQRFVRMTNRNEHSVWTNTNLNWSWMWRTVVRASCGIPSVANGRISTQISRPLSHDWLMFTKKKVFFVRLLPQSVGGWYVDILWGQWDPSGVDGPPARNVSLKTGSLISQSLVP